MTMIRRRLRLLVAAWLVFQVAAVSPLLSGACCVAHQPAPRGDGHGCHESAGPAPCPMAAADGMPCPMHRGHHGTAGETGETRNARCSMRGTCGGPLAALLALLSNHGIPSDSFVTLPDLRPTPAPDSTRERLASRLASPDPPPPRA